MRQPAEVAQLPVVELGHRSSATSSPRIVAARRYAKIVTRFPPEPNGYLHIGHAKSICLNFGIAREHGGQCNLRFDDTNPVKEDVEYVESITADVRWLIAGWADHCLGFKPGRPPGRRSPGNGQPDYPRLRSPAKSAGAEPFFASDYFEQLYDYAVELIKRGKAYVCDLTPGGDREIPRRPRQTRARPPSATAASPRTSTSSRACGRRVSRRRPQLRAKIDMASPNMWLRDPLLYRIRHTPHHHAGDKWCIYPLYDFAHCLSDYLEGITHSICTLEFVHRPLYDWILESLGLPRALPHQYEFAKLNLTYTLVSASASCSSSCRRSHVTGWDDPRMPTLSGLRRRGIPASALRAPSSPASASPSSTASPTSPSSSTPSARNSTPPPAPPRRAQAHQARPHQPRRRRNRRLRRHQQPAGREPDHPHARPHARGVHRERRLRRGAAAEVLPPQARRRSAPQIRLHHQVRRDREGRRRRHHRAPLHRRPHTRTGGPTPTSKVKGTIHWVSATSASTPRCASTTGSSPSPSPAPRTTS
jgi:glutaminyl-tRNA synthetase